MTCIFLVDVCSTRTSLCWALRFDEWLNRNAPKTHILPKPISPKVSHRYSSCNIELPPLHCQAFSNNHLAFSYSYLKFERWILVSYLSCNLNRKRVFTFHRVEPPSPISPTASISTTFRFHWPRLQMSSPAPPRTDHPALYIYIYIYI